MGLTSYQNIIYKNQDSGFKNIISTLISDIIKKKISFLFIPNKINP